MHLSDRRVLTTEAESRIAHFEGRFLNGERPPLEEYLLGLGQGRLALLIELVHVEMELRLKAGEPARVEDYLERFPEIPHEAASSLRAVELVHPAIYTGTPAKLNGSMTSKAQLSESAWPPIPGYEINGEIARGGMGAVLAARDATFGREVAIKVLLPKLSGDNEAVRRFVREARITGRLQHPGIPPAHAFGTLPDGSPFLAMKLIQGRTLADQLEERKSPAENLSRFIQVFEQICQAVGYAHAEGIIHRDLKPANVMVGAFGEVQVMDWGLAKDLRVGDEDAQDDDSKRIEGPRGQDSETVAGQVVGTPSFMAPEQARGDPVDVRADVFAIGGILAAILTGKAPFIGTTVEDTVRKAATASLDDIFARLNECAVEAELVALAKLCLSPRREDRLPDAGEVAKRVAAYRAGVERRLRNAEQTAAAAEARTMEEANTRREAEAKAVEQRKRRRTQFALTAALAALAALVVMALWWDERRAAKSNAAALQRQIEEEQQTSQRQIEEERQAAAERERLTRNRDAIAALLQAGEEALKAEDADKAAIAFHEADRRMAEKDVETFHLRLEHGQHDLAMLRELDRLYELRWINVSVEGQIGFRSMVPEWPAAFAKFGLRLGVTSTADAARMINESHIRDRLIMALDLWLCHAHLSGVFEILQAVDSDPYRDEVRQAILGDHKERILELAARPAALTQPFRFGLVLGGHGLIPMERREKILLSYYRQKPNDLTVLMTLGQLYPVNQLNGAVERAGWYRAALATRPNYLAAWISLGVALHDKKDFDGAIACGMKALELEPKSALVHNNLGAALLDKGDWVGAAKCYREAIILNPKFPLAHFNLGNVQNALKDPEGAIASFKEAIRLDPKFSQAYYRLGAVLLERNERDAAATWYKKAIEVNSEDAIAYSNLGAVYLMKKQYPEAIEYARKATELDPNYPRAHGLLGEALLRTGDRFGAEVAWKKAARLDPQQFGYLLKRLPPIPVAPPPRERTLP